MTEKTIKTTEDQAHAWATAAGRVGISRLEWVRATLDAAAGGYLERAWRHAVDMGTLDPDSPAKTVRVLCEPEQVDAWNAAADRAGINSLNRWACTVLNVAAGASDLHTQLGRVRPLLRESNDG